MTVPRVLVITVESPWPTLHGGRLRTARIVEQLSRVAEVTVVFPENGASEQPSAVVDFGDAGAAGRIAAVPLRWSRSGGPTRLVRTPHLGLYYLAPIRSAIQEILARISPDVVFWSHSYLAAVPKISTGPAASIVEFANVERDRFRSRMAGGAPGTPLAVRAARALEWAKAARWEPRVAAQADLAVALSPKDGAVLARHARQVLVVPNGMDLRPYVPSPAAPRVLAVASWTYGPNREAMGDFLRHHWGRVRDVQPAAELLMVGAGGERLLAEQPLKWRRGVRALGFVPDLTAVYQDCAIVLAPATAGAGQQLKVTEALAHGRVVVGPRHLAASSDPDVPAAVSAGADVAAEVLRNLADPAARHRLEGAAYTWAASRSWAEVTAPLRERVARNLVAARGRAEQT